MEFDIHIGWGELPIASYGRYYHLESCVRVCACVCIKTISMLLVVSFNINFIMNLKEEWKKSTTTTQHSTSHRAFFCVLSISFHRFYCVGSVAFCCIFFLLVVGWGLIFFSFSFFSLYFFVSSSPCLYSS